MVTQLLFAAVVFAIVGIIAGDWARSRRNTRRLEILGAYVHGTYQTRAYLAGVGLWSVAAIFEVIHFDRGIHLLPAVVALAAIGLGHHLRRSAHAALGQRWTLDVASLPGNPLVTGGLYGRMRHPEYTGTLLLLLAVPLLHGAWLTSFATALVGSALVVRRVRLEEAVLEEDARYGSLMGGRPRFHPRRSVPGTTSPARPTRLDPKGRRGGVPGHG